VVSTVFSNAVGINVVSTISGYTIGTYMVSAVFGNDLGVKLVMAIDGWLSEGAGSQNGEGQAEDQFGSFHGGCSRSVRSCC
jgi:hypothetical protein